MSNDPNTHMNEARIAAHESPTDVYGHTQATLALAYEQRTANLIALYTDGNAGKAPGVNYQDLAKQILERLDL